jgi:hypothetical protein
MTGYYVTPNKNVPLNDREPGTIAQVALDQLAEWNAIAERWHYRETDNEVRCDYCGQNLWFVHDKHGVMYDYSREELLALTVAHIRQNHSEVISESH